MTVQVIAREGISVSCYGGYYDDTGLRALDGIIHGGLETIDGYDEDIFSQMIDEFIERNPKAKDWQFEIRVLDLINDFIPAV